MHSRICSLSRSFRECYFCLYPTCLKYLAKWQVITRIICHFLVRKASDNCYCDNFFDIVAAQIMLTVHADFWHVHAKFNRGAGCSQLCHDYYIFLIFFGAKMPLLFQYLVGHCMWHRVKWMTLLIKSGSPI